MFTVFTARFKAVPIKKGTDYGLSVYDHIVLDANAVTGNGMIIYQ